MHALGNMTGEGWWERKKKKSIRMTRFVVVTVVITRKKDVGRCIRVTVVVVIAENRYRIHRIHRDEMMGR